MIKKMTGFELANKNAYNAGNSAIRPFIGDQMNEYGLSRMTHLATNESQYPPSPKVIQAMQEAMQIVNLYPDPSSTLLRRKLAHLYKIKENMVLIGNGADELLYMVGKAFIEKGDNAIISKPSYPTDSIAMASMGCEVRTIEYRPDFSYDLEKILNVIDEGTKVIILCTPGNPSTVTIQKDELEIFMKQVPSRILIVMDESYKEFVTDKNSADPMLYFTEDRNIIFLRTFSKYYGLAGLRIGYALGPEHIIDVLRRSIPAFSVNSIAQAGAIAAIDDTSYYTGVLQKLILNREFLTEGLLRSGMDPVRPSQTNFLFVNTGNVPPEEFERVLFQSGIFIRRTNYDSYSQYVRMAVGKKKQNEIIISIAQDLCNKYRR